MRSAWIPVVLLLATLLFTGACTLSTEPYAPSTQQPRAPAPLAPEVRPEAMSTASAVDRDFEPVVVTGADLPEFLDTPTDSLFVYAYRDGDLEQIPFQLDEVTAGVYAPTQGNPLDEDDELVFMASDLGDLPPDEELVATLPISSTWYRLEVSDPVNPTMRGWACLVRSSSLTQTFTETYAAFDPPTNQMTTTQYALGLAENYPYFDHLALNKTGVGILDRSKIRIETQYLGTHTEESLLLRLDSVGLVKDGPVRVIVREGSVIGYRGMFQVSLIYALPPALGVSAIRLSTDFDEDAVPSTYYNANIPAGVTVDGNPDSIAQEPPSLWWQLSGDTGTIVQVSDASQSGGTLLNYYRDDDTTPEPKPSGDGKSYGDSGLKVESPNPTVSYRAVVYVLPPDQENVGETYAGYFENPLEVTATVVLPYRTHLPLVLRH